CRTAADCPRKATAIIHVNARRTVAFAEHAVRNVSAGSQLLSRFMFSSPFRPSRSTAPADPAPLQRFVKLPRPAMPRPPSPRTLQKMSPLNVAERTAGPHPEEPRE